MIAAALFPAGPVADRVTIRRPDDRHIHLRDNAVLKAARFAHRIIVQTLVPPVTSVAAASACRGRIRAALPEG